MCRSLRWVFAAALIAGCASGTAAPRQQQQNGIRLEVGLPPAIPDTTGWGVHVLTLARGWVGSMWAGTYGDGIKVLRPGA